MKQLAVSDQTSIHDLAVFIHEIDSAECICGRQEEGRVVLYARQRSVTDLLRESLVPRRRAELRRDRQLALQAIESVLDKRDGGSQCDGAMLSILPRLADTRHDLHPAELREAVKALDTSEGMIAKQRALVENAFAPFVRLQALRLRSSAPPGAHWSYLVGEQRVLQDLRHFVERDRATDLRLREWLLRANHGEEAELRASLHAFHDFLACRLDGKKCRIDYPGIMQFKAYWTAAMRADREFIMEFGWVAQVDALLYDMTAGPTPLPGISLVTGRLTCCKADIFVMTAGMETDDKNAFAGTPWQELVDALEARLQQGFENGITAVSLPHGFLPSGAETAIAAHCAPRGTTTEDELRAVYRQISARIQQWRSKSTRGTNSLLVPPLGVDKVHRFPKAQGLAVLAQEVLRMREHNPGLDIRVLVPDDVTEAEVNAAFLAELARPLADA